MKRTLGALGALLLGSSLAGLPGSAGAVSGVWSRPNLTPQAALKAAQAASAECEKQGWQVAVALTDASGLPLVVLRNRYAGWHTLDAAIGKARTAASWRSDTAGVAQQVLRPGAPEQGITHVPGVLMLGGGVPVEAAGQVVGAIGVSGAPGVDNDVHCAQAGIAAIEDELSF